MGRFNVKNEEKASLDANKKRRGFCSKNNVQREAFSGMSESLNALQIKLNCREGNKVGRFSECLRVTTVYLITKLKGSGEVEMSIRNGEVFKPASIVSAA